MTEFKVPEKWIRGDLHKFVFRGEFADWLIADDRNKRFRMNRKADDIWIDFFVDKDALEFIEKWREDEV